MKLLLFVLLLSGQAFAQSTTERYIQLEANVDWYGDPVWIKQAHYPKDRAARPDTLINTVQIDSLIKAEYRKGTPITVLNRLAAEGWVLVSTAFVPGDEKNSLGEKGRLLYFLKKSFPLKDRSIRE